MAGGARVADTRCMAFAESWSHSNPHQMEHSHEQEEYMFEESQNFTEWRKWDQLLREHSAGSKRDSPPPQIILITPPSSPASLDRNENQEIHCHHYSDARDRHRHYKDPRRPAQHNHTHHAATRDSSAETGLDKEKSRHRHHHHHHDSHHHDSHRRHHHHSHHEKENRDSWHLGHSVEPSRTDSSHHDLLEPELSRRTVVAGAPGRDFLERDNPRNSMSEGESHLDFQPRRWTAFEHEPDLYHLSDRHLNCHTDDLGFPKEITVPTKPENLGFPPMAKVISLSVVRGSQSEPRLLRRAHSEGSLINTPPEVKRWSPKRLVCGSSQDNLGAFPTFDDHRHYRKNHGAILPSPPELVRRSKRHVAHNKWKGRGSDVSVQTAPAMCAPLESKKHDHLDEARKQRHHHHLHSQRHKEFKQNMKTLLEEEYSPYYVKSRTPSLLSHLTGTSDDKSEARATAWRSPARRRGSRRDWFERSDSKKGKMVSAKPRSMQMVFFQSIPEDKEEVFAISTIEEVEEQEEENGEEEKYVLL